jgi:uncharacterized protein YciI
VHQWIYVLKPVRPGMLTSGATPEEERIVSQHYAYLKALTEKGVMILVGRTQNDDETTFGIAIFEIEDEETARSVMENDPAVRHGAMSATFYPDRVTLMRK